MFYWASCASVPLLALPAFAQDTPSQTKHELTQAPVFKPWTGDLDGMVKRRVIRALVAPSRTSYWLNGARQTGAEYELLKAFEKEINEKYKTQGKHIRTSCDHYPDDARPADTGAVGGPRRYRSRHLDGHTGTPRTGRFRRAVLPRRQANRGDGTGVARTGLPRRSFGQGSVRPQVVELLDSSRSISTSDSRKSRSRRSSSRPRRRICRTTICWKWSMPDSSAPSSSIGIRLCCGQKSSRSSNAREDLVVHEGGDIAWMIRKDSPKLKAEIAEFAKNYGQKSDFGNDAGQEVHRQPTGRKARDVGRRDQEVSGDGRVLSKIRSPVRHGLSADDGTGLSGIPARSERQEPCRARSA